MCKVQALGGSGRSNVENSNHAGGRPHVVPPGIKTLISAEADMEVVGEASNGSECDR